VEVWVNVPSLKPTEAYRSGQTDVQDEYRADHSTGWCDRPVESSTVLLVGLTGGIGAGKSTVGELLTERGAILIDGDVIARRVVEPAIVERFGPEVLAPDGSLDRPALAARAFGNDEDRKALEAITHPAIGAEFVREMSEAPPDAIVVNDVPLLVESQKAAERGYEYVIVVEAPRELRLDRLVARGLERADAEARMAAQATDEQRRAIATHVLDNGGTREQLAAQVDEVWNDLRSKAAGKGESGK
jgi:dephospho-CoA kinase